MLNIEIWAVFNSIIWRLHTSYVQSIMSVCGNEIHVSNFWVFCIFYIEWANIQRHFEKSESLIMFAFWFRAKVRLSWQRQWNLWICNSTIPKLCFMAIFVNFYVRLPTNCEDYEYYVLALEMLTCQLKAFSGPKVLGHGYLCFRYIPKHGGNMKLFRRNFVECSVGYWSHFHLMIIIKCGVSSLFAAESTTIIAIHLC